MSGVKVALIGAGSRSFGPGTVAGAEEIALAALRDVLAEVH